MDRYEFVKDYAAAKHRIFRNQTSEDVAILNADDEIVSSWVNGLRANVVMFSVRRELADGLFLKGRNELVSRTANSERVLMIRNEMQLRGLHNVENVLAAFAVGLACGASPDSMRETARKFEPVEHRMERVAVVNNVTFYNDSKATSVDATLKALEALADDDGKVILILGGRGKKASYAPLSNLVRAKVRRLILMGEDAATIESELKNDAPSERVESLSEAVRRGFDIAEAGDSVLFAPACSSFDMFSSFEHRGKVFKEAVRAVRKTVTGTQDSGLRTKKNRLKPNLSES